MSDWKNVQYKDGKMRTSEGGGGGSATFAGLDDVNFSNLQNGQVAKYNSTTQKWENSNESGGSGHNYSTTEQVIGTWIDSKPLYEKTFEFSALNNSADATNDISGLNVDTVAYLRGMAYAGFECPIMFGDPYDIPNSIITVFTIKSSGLLCVRTRRSDASSFSAVVTMQYTKTTD